ncbi:MAG: tRNA (5-methylaminomethyl-2-thiouridine)(34)-methyltransferase MnmD, partial [Pseudomonadota bacterium]
MTSTTDLPGSNDPALVWGEDGLPRSGRFDDVYFSSDDGLAESRAVFLEGCGLPGAWRGRRRFVVGELGFGSGLNIAALLDLWRREGPADGRLHVFSVEAFPLAREDAARALARWPELDEAAGALLAGWPGRAAGFHRLELPDFRAVLDLAVMEAGAALSQWAGAADAWFFDGFAPAANPDMWRQEVLDLVAARSAPGARAGTFTVAGAVRRGLAAAGFAVAKAPGHGRKRERLEARLEGVALDPSPPRVAVIGAGIAGAALARGLRALGVEPLVFDPQGPATGASGNPAGLMAPRLDAGLGPAARLHAQAYARTAALCAAHPEAVIARGARELEGGPRDAGRFDTIAAADLFEPGAMVRTEGALEMPGALVLDPPRLIGDWLGEVRRAAVARIEPRHGGLALIDADGGTLASVDAVCICAGHDSAGFAPDLTLQPVRGQVSWARGAPLETAVSGAGYAVPMRDGALFGATFDRDRTDEGVDPADDDRNLDLLRRTLPDLAAAVAGRPLGARASIRAATRDRLPLAGPLPGAPG